YGPGNIIRANLVRWNGTTSEGGRRSGGRSGDGIRIHAATAGTVVRGNRSFGNRADGIRVDGRSNLITNNRTGGNGAGGRGYDLHDSNRHPSCDGNVWAANTVRTAVPDCTRGGPRVSPTRVERSAEPLHTSALIVRSSGLPSVRTVARSAGSR